MIATTGKKWLAGGSRRIDLGGRDGFQRILGFVFRLQQET
jgi:hypothetical protein